MKYQTIFPSLKKSLFIFILSFSMLIFTLPTSTFAQSNDNVISVTNYYVSPTGNDLNPGTLDQPFATIQKAANMYIILVPQGHQLLFKITLTKMSFSLVLKTK